MRQKRELSKWPQGGMGSTSLISRLVVGQLTCRALNLCLYNPQSHQWSLNFAGGDSGVLSQPRIGEFKNGRGEFFDQETLNGRAILVRFALSDITPKSCHFEQAFSEDGGKTWEVNWIATERRVKLRI